MTIFTILCWLLLVVPGIAASAQTSGTATGTLTVNGRATKLSHAQALETQDYTLGADRKLVQVTVIKVFLSDTPIEDQEDHFDLGVRGKEGKLHGLQVTISKEGEPLSGALYHKAFQNGALSMSLGGALFEPNVFNDKTVSGKVRMEKPMEFSGVTFDFDVTFSAPVQQEPKPTVEGPAAADTGPGKAVQEFLRATGAKDVAALKRILRKEFAEMLEKPEGQETVMAMLDQFYAADELKQMKIVRVFDFGNRAWVEGLSKRPSTSGGAPTDVTYRIRAVRVNGEWKVQPM